ncbi:adenylylsulfatase HINT3 [Andrographis paniculata]|uniref:adenylylsulfatase HINT3 n=1 Tax=Andrographis paniculata TaxID=175694 RepID=UPI0021E826BD|nr:adenylylsulfatase HINT3 [Andrographis paniculata]
MESVARRRLDILCSHLGPLAEASQSTRLLVHSRASSSDGGGEKEASAEDNGMDCVFCKIIRRESPALKIYEDNECICILDKYPLCYGHSLIIPKDHFPSLDATPPSIIGSMCSKVPLISEAVMKATDCDSFNLLVNNGAAAGQVVYHTHIHIIPRKAHDCLWTSESIRRLPLKIDEEGLQIAKRIRQNLPLGNGCEDSKTLI